MKTPTDRVFVEHMISAVERIAEVRGRIERAEFDDDWVFQDAVIRELEIIGEAAGRLSPEVRAANSDLPWSEMTGMRHKLIHDYFEVDLDVVWRTAVDDVPPLLPSLRRVLSSL